MKKKKFTFKKEPRNTGLYSVGHPHSETNIKLDGHEVGTIAPPSWHTEDRKWVIRLKVVSKTNDNPNCSWHWITLNKKFKDEPSARVFLNENFDAIFANGLHIESEL